MTIDEIYIQRCIDLALKGKGIVAPNPLVGAVIVHNGEIIGEGYHQHYGGAHAEVNAVAAVENKAILKEATIYVSLEPCAHFGKTPPCADLIVKYQFKRVVVGCLDSFSEVSGKGIQRMQEHGITVEVGVLEHECRELNKRFFIFHEKQRPYVILKWAQTSDGFIDKTRNEGDTGVNWITQPETQQIVHQWRAEEVAILVGKNTVLNDNPSLTVRAVKGNNPIRIVLDSHLEISETSAVFDGNATTYIFNLKENKVIENTHWVQLADMQVATILKQLYLLNIQSVIIEGGAATIQSFQQSNLWDEARVLIGAVDFHSGLKSPEEMGELMSEEHMDKDIIRTYRNTTSN